MKDRIGVYDFVKFFAIVTVVWGHVMQDLYNTQMSVMASSIHPMYVFIYSFHMPLFAVVSGLFAKSVLSKPYMPVILHKIRQLIIPAICGGG